MKILFIGNFQQGPGGETADEVHLARELSRYSELTRVSRDEWREYVLEDQPKDKYKVPEKEKFDIAIIAKWHHFFDNRFITTIQEKYNCPVFYWVWDSMEGHTVGDWHMNMAQAADLYLSGELGRAPFYRENGVRFYYFQFDSVDGSFKSPTHIEEEKIYDVVYPGSLNNQNGRLDLLKEINEHVKIKVFAYDHEEWKKQGFDASPAVYGDDFNEMIGRSKIILGTSCDPNLYGYWSNRVGKVLYAGGFLLQQYTPGMEQFLAGRCDFYSSAEEAIEKIEHYLNRENRDPFYEVNNIPDICFMNTSKYKAGQLVVLIDRYLESNGGEKWILP